jgi:hypothetical protein
MFPKKGKLFPKVTRMGKAALNYPAAIAAALRAELGNSHQAVKTVMRWTGANERTVKNWLAGRRGPRGEHLLGLIRHSDMALGAVLALAGREQIIAAKALLDARDLIAEILERIDQWVAREKHAGRSQ